MPSAISDITDDKVKKIYDSVYELEKVFPVRSYDELKAMLNEHYYCTVVKDEVDVIEPSTPVVSKKSVTAPVSTKTEVTDDDINSLLKELDTAS